MTSLASSSRPLAGTQPGAGGATARCPAGLAEIAPERWDALLGPASAPLRHAFLRAWEQSELAGLRSCPVVVTERGSERLLGASPGYLYDLDLLTVRWPQTAGVMRALRRRWPRALIARAFEIGTPVPLANPLLIAEGGARAAVASALITAALEQSRVQGASFVLVQNFTSREGVVAEQLRDHGLTPVPIPPTAVVDITHASFEEYLGSMRAQYRRRANKTFARTRGLDIEQLRDFSGLADELARLWHAIYERATEVRREVLTPAFFRQAAEIEETSVLLARRADGSLAAFALLLDDGDMLSFMQCGFEEAAGREEGAYFRLLYEIVRLGIERRFRLVDLGITTLAPKLDVGAVPVPLFAWIKHRNPLFQLAITQLARGPLQNPGPLEPRRVFKDPPRSAAEIAARTG